MSSSCDSNILAFSSEETCPLSFSSCLRLARSTKSRLRSRMPPATNQKVVMTPMMPGMRREVTKNLMFHQFLGQV